MLALRFGEIAGSCLRLDTPMPGILCQVYSECQNNFSCPSMCWVPLTAPEPPHDKTNNVAVRPAKTQVSLGIRPV